MNNCEKYKIYKIYNDKFSILSWKSYSFSIEQHTNSLSIKIFEKNIIIKIVPFKIILFIHCVL